MNKDSLKGKTVLVVGGSSGIGLGIALVCSNKGARVVIASRSVEKMKKAQEKLQTGSAVEPVDILSTSSVESLFERVGKVNHIVVSSGSVTRAEFENLSEDEAKSDFELNVWGKYRVAKCGKSNLDENGSILFISGAFSKRPNPKVFITSVAVATVEALTKNLAKAIAPIRVNAVCPYVIDNSAVDEGSVSRRSKQMTDIAENLPANYVGTPVDVGEAAVSIMNNRYATGSIFVMDGGYTL